MDEIYRKVNKMLMKDIDTTIEEKKENIINNTRFDYNSWIKSKGKNSRTVQDTAIRLADDCNINELEKWNKVKNKAFKHYSEKYPYNDIIRLKYIEKNLDKDVYTKLNIERSWYFDRKKEIIILATIFAYKENLVEI